VVHLAGVEPMSWAGGERARFLLRAADTGGLFSFYEVVVPPGEGSVFHIHLDMDETFYVVDGEFVISVGDAVHRVGTGTVVYGPRGVGHSFVSSGAGPSRMLCVTTPGGIETFFEELGALLRAGGRPEWERMRDLASRHRIISFRPAEDGSPDAALSHLWPKGS
jgi:mannose-6-phosphate isomerase-like protein (cupin superfamily)